LGRGRDQPRMLYAVCYNRLGFRSMPGQADHEQQPLARSSSPRFTPLASKRRSQRAYEEIRAYLMRGRLKPGERLVSRLLASELGISTTPVREALARLASEKALELDHRNTVVVPTLTAERYEEIRDLRAQLEGLAAMRAAGATT